ncbi:MAG TPA: hypothetical protein VM659_04245 [Dongiaceae bacterium]|nr:hypothetical protein [Dongiaceae bacterium]
MLEKLFDPNNVWFQGFVCVLLVLLAFSYRSEDLAGPVGLLGLAMLILAKRYGRRLDALQAEIAALRAQLAAAPLPGRNTAADQG